MATDHTDVEVADRDELATAIGLYVLGEVSVGKAAEQAGVTRWEFLDILQEAGIPTRLGPRTKEEAQEDTEAALDVE